MATRPESEPLVNVTVVVVQKYSMHHMKFDLSPAARVAELKRELQKILKIPWEQQKWMLRQCEIDDSKSLDQCKVEEADVIELHLRRP